MGTTKKSKDGIAALTERQRRFVIEFAKDGNATQAAIRAGYAKATANREGTRLLSKAVVRQHLDQRLAKAAENVDVSRERVLRELASMAFAPLGNDFVGATEKIAAINRINKMQGYEIHRHEISGPGGTPLAIAVDLSRLTDEELAAAEAIAQRIETAQDAPGDAGYAG